MTQRSVTAGFTFVSWSLLPFPLRLIGTSFGGSSWNVITSQASKGIWEFTRCEGKSQQHCKQQKPEERTSASWDKSAHQAGAIASVNSWGELEPHGIRGIDLIRGPAANLELRMSGESELSFPADQMRSDQRARWNYFILPKAPFRTRARAAGLMPVVFLKPWWAILRAEWGGSFKDCLGKTNWNNHSWKL